MDLTKTVELLDSNMDQVVKNERQIVDTIGDILTYLDRADKRFAHLEGHIGQLTKRPAVIVKPNGKAFLIVACVASGYFGYKLADRKFREKIQEMAKQAKETAERAAEQAREQFEKAGQDARSQAKQGTYYVDNTASSDEPPVQN